MTAKKILWIAGAITSIGGAGTMLWAGYNNAPVPESVKEYHVEEQAEERGKIDELIGLAVIPTIPPLIKIVREDPCNHGMRELLHERIDTYNEKLGRVYDISGLPECEE